MASSSSPQDVAASPTSETRTGHLAGVDADGRVLFRPEDSEESFAVVIGLEIADDQLVHEAWLGRRALAVRTSDAEGRWVLTALLRERVSERAREAGPGEVQATVDGKTVRLRAAEELELRCGKARLVLKKNGRIELNGTHVVSRSRGPNKMKGASIELN